IQQPLTLVAVLIGNLEDRANILLNRKAAENRRLLGKVANPEPCPPVHRQVREVDAVELDRPVIGGNQSRDHVEHGRLACPVRAQQADGFPTSYGETHPPDDRPALVALADRSYGEAVWLSDRPE